MLRALPLLVLFACNHPADPPAPADPAPVAETIPELSPPPEVTPEDPDERPRGELADGASCLTGGDCASGICEGEGCGDDQPGTCAPEARMCTRDLRPYCGCDGETFRTSGSCPGRRYAHTGSCPVAE